jgi:hypothetical protein
MDYLLGGLLVLAGVMSTLLIISAFHYGYRKDQEKAKKNNSL